MACYVQFCTTQSSYTVCLKVRQVCYFGGARSDHQGRPAAYESIFLSRWRVVLQPCTCTRLAPAAPAEGAAVSGVAQAGDGEKAKRFLPFSDGRRDCAGQALAKMNVTAALAILLGHFHFELTPEVSPSHTPPFSLSSIRPAPPCPAQSAFSYVCCSPHKATHEVKSRRTAQVERQTIM